MPLSNGNPKQRLLILACTIVFAAPAFSADSEEKSADTAPHLLFNGETLDGWEGDLKWFHVEDGAIVTGSLEEKIPHNQFLCTQETYGDFELRFQVKIEGNANGGIQFRSKRLPGTTEVSGFQADLGWSFWGCLYDESRRNTTLAGPGEQLQNELVKKDDWNDYVIHAEGNRIQLFLNGVKTVDYIEEDDAIARDGIIGLQIHSGPPTRVWYKGLMIRELSSSHED